MEKNPMLEPEYIDRKKLLGKQKYINGDYYIPLWNLLMAPVEDVAPVVHGEWQPYRDYFSKRHIGWICTNCSGVQMDLSNGDTNYCPNCGARMDGDG